MRVIAIALLVLIGSVAHAGTIVITVTTATGVCSTPCSKTYTETDANLAKAIPAYQSSCNIKINGTCTNLQVLAHWFDQLVAKTVSDVQANQIAAQQQGLVPPAPINPQ